jgi:hypothetical protein
MRWLVNPVVRTVLRSPAGRWTGALLLLEFDGRRTGRRLRVPVVGHPHEGALYALTDAPWAANFRGGAPVRVSRRGRRWSARGELVADPRETAAVLRATIAATGARSIGLRLPAGATPSDEDLCALRRAVRLSGAGPVG